MKKIISLIIALTAIFSAVTIMPMNAAKNMGYAYPVPGVKVFQKYKNDAHKGIDIAADRGTKIYATKSGTIVARYEGCANDNGYRDNGVKCSAKGVCKPNFNTKSGFCNDGFGNGFIIKHDDNTWAMYGHLKTLADNLKVGTHVNQGDYLGGMGSSGRSTGSHLHFEIREASDGTTANDFWKAKHVNPMNFMDTDDKGVVLNDGMYKVTSSINKKYALSVADESKTSKANIRIETDGNKKSQKFNISHMSGGYYRITNVNSGKVLDAESGGTTSGTNVWQYNLNNTDAQLWRIELNSDGTYTFINKKSNLCLDVSGGEAKNKQNVQIYSKNNSAAQKWNISKAEVSCTHSAYTAYGYCNKCGMEYISPIVGVTATGTIKKDKTPVRLRPYSAEKTIYTLGKGASVTIAGYAFNSYHNVWYIMANGEWIYSGNVDLPAIANVKMVENEVTFANGKVPQLSMNCSYTGTRPSEVGLYIGTTKANMKIFASDKITFSKNPFGAWYEYNGAKKGTTYYYQFYSIVNGVIKTTDIKTFIIGGSKIMDPVAEIGLDISISPTTQITATTARVNGSCSYTGTKPTEIGLKVGYAENALAKISSDVVDFTKNPFDLWYDLKNLKADTKYYYALYAIVDGVEIVSDTGSFTTAKGVVNDLVDALPKDSLSITNSAVTKLTKNTARVNAVCSYSGTKPTEVGLYLGTDSENLKKHSSDAINFTKNPFDMWYDLSGLNENTKYYYKMYAIVGGKTVWGAIGSFTTAKGVVNDLVEALPKSNLSITNSAVTKLTKNTARVNAVCSYSGTKPTEVGLYLGTDAGNLKKHSSDVINFSKNPFDIWYELSALSADTTYYYKIYAIVGGNTVWGELKSFKTAKGFSSDMISALPSENTRTGIVTGTNGDNLAINDKAAASPKYSNEIGVIPPGAQMTVYPDKAVGNWYYVTYNGISGYAYGKYITFK